MPTPPAEDEPALAELDLQLSAVGDLATPGGILRGECTLLRFDGVNYSDPRYAGTYYTYDAWGNRDSVSTYRSEGTLTALYQGTACVSTTPTPPAPTTPPLARTLIPSTAPARPRAAAPARLPANR